LATFTNYYSGLEGSLSLDGDNVEIMSWNGVRTWKEADVTTKGNLAEKSVPISNVYTGTFKYAYDLSKHGSGGDTPAKDFADGTLKALVLKFDSSHTHFTGNVWISSQTTDSPVDNVVTGECSFKSFGAFTINE
jgi:hypothetical protein